MNKLYTQKSIYKATITLLVIGVMYNVFRSYGYVSKYDKVTNIIMLIALLSVAGRDFYLPFLGDAVIPSGALNLGQVPLNANVSTVVKVPPNSKVIYWAAEPSESTKKEMPWKAYREYSNAGVVAADEKGNATVSIRSPQEYKTPWGKQLKPHVHYRYSKTHGMYSKVYTVYLN